MPKASKVTPALRLAGGTWTVGFESYSEDADLAPYFKGLPNDECQCEHRAT